MDGITRFNISNYISSVDTVPQITKEETFGTALSLVGNSHTAVYVMGENGEFAGLVVPYQARYQHHFPYTKRVQSDIFIPPFITEETPLYDVAGNMISTRIYNLPAFDEKKHLIGPVHAKDILLGITQDRDFLYYVSQTILVKKPIIASIHSTVEDVYHMLRQKEVSRIILVDEKGGVSAIVTRSDILRAFVHPTDKQRFSKKSGDSGYFAFDEEKEYRQDDPVRKYATETVETVSDQKTMTSKIQKLIFSKYNSIVIVDKGNNPVGFISLRDVLEAVYDLRPKSETVPIVMQKPSVAVDKKDLSLFEEMLNRMGRKIQKRTKLEKIEVTFDEPKYSDGQTAVFNTTIIVTPLKGEKLIAKTKHNIFINSVSDAISEIHRQEEKSETKHNTREDSFASI